jgi:hypothetical protein
MPVTTADTQAPRARTTRRWVAITLGAGIAGLLVFCATLFWTIGKTTPLDAADLAVTQVDNVAFVIEPITESDGRITVTGWILLDGEPFDQWDNTVIIANLTTGHAFAAPTELVARPDISEARNAGLADSQKVNYTNSGFLARFPATALQGPQDDYRIYIRINSGGRDLLIDTTTTLGLR